MLLMRCCLLWWWIMRWWWWCLVGLGCCWRAWMTICMVISHLRMFISQTYRLNHRNYFSWQEALGIVIDLTRELNPHFKDSRIWRLLSLSLSSNSLIGYFLLNLNCFCADVSRQRFTFSFFTFAFVLIKFSFTYILELFFERRSTSVSLLPFYHPVCMSVGITLLFSSVYISNLSFSSLSWIHFSFKVFFLPHILSDDLQEETRRNRVQSKRNEEFFVLVMHIDRSKDIPLLFRHSLYTFVLLVISLLFDCFLPSSFLAIPILHSCREKMMKRRQWNSSLWCHLQHERRRWRWKRTSKNSPHDFHSFSSFILMAFFVPFFHFVIRVANKSIVVLVAQESLLQPFLCDLSCVRICSIISIKLTDCLSSNSWNNQVMLAIFFRVNRLYRMNWIQSVLVLLFSNVFFCFRWFFLSFFPSVTGSILVLLCRCTCDDDVNVSSSCTPLVEAFLQSLEYSLFPIEMEWTVKRSSSFSFTLFFSGSLLTSVGGQNKRKITVTWAWSWYKSELTWRRERVDPVDPRFSRFFSCPDPLDASVSLFFLNSIVFPTCSVTRFRNRERQVLCRILVCLDCLLDWLDTKTDFLLFHWLIQMPLLFLSLFSWFSLSILDSWHDTGNWIEHQHMGPINSGWS